MGIEVVIGLGLLVIEALAGAGVLLAAPAVVVGQTALGVGAAGLVGAGGAAASSMNPFIAGGFQAASADAYNNAVQAASQVANGLNLPFLPTMNVN